MLGYMTKFSERWLYYNNFKNRFMIYDDWNMYTRILYIDKFYLFILKQIYIYMYLYFWRFGNGIYILWWFPKRLHAHYFMIIWKSHLCFVTISEEKRGYLEITQRPQINRIIHQYRKNWKEHSDRMEDHRIRN